MGGRSATILQLRTRVQIKPEADCMFPAWIHLTASVRVLSTRATPPLSDTINHRTAVQEVNEVRLSFVKAHSKKD